MNDSDFWRDLAKEFRAIDPRYPSRHDSLRAEWDSFDGQDELWIIIETGDGDEVRANYHPLGRRAGYKIDPSSPNSLVRWLVELRETGFPSDSTTNGVVPQIGGKVLNRSGGCLKKLCERSVILCKKLEDSALERERTPLNNKPPVEALKIIPVASGELKNRIDEEVFAAHAVFTEDVAVSEGANLQARSVAFIVSLFDIHAGHHCELVSDYNAARGWYEHYITTLTAHLTQHAIYISSGWAPPLDKLRFARETHSRLFGRSSYWKSEALKRARENPNLSYDQMSAPPNPASEAAVIQSSGSSPSDEKLRRAELLAAYKLATKDPSNKSIYEAKNSGIHKPEFYGWVSGELSATSATCINFERFLKLQKPPVRRQ